MLHYCQACDCTLNKSSQIYPGPMLPPGDRNWQKFYPNFCIAKKKKVLKIFENFLEVKWLAICPMASDCSWLLGIRYDMNVWKVPLTSSQRAYVFLR